MFDDLTPAERGALAVLALSAQHHVIHAHDSEGRYPWAGDALFDISGTLCWIAAHADPAYVDTLIH